MIRDFEAPVTGLMKYIKPDYTSELGVQTVKINHTDGIGMMLPSVSTENFMVRAPWIKGLLTSFDFLKFCEVHGVEPVIEDYWGQVHNLIDENIRIIFTESQFKFAKYYDNWDHYKYFFKKHDCRMNRLNYEEDFIPDANLNYQMLQTLIDFTDEEIEMFAKHTRDRIVDLGKSKDSMLKALGAAEDAEKASGRALYLYPELLREAYFRDTIKDIRKRWLYDARSGKIRCRNKRLFAIPDMYAACQHWFLHQEQPEGLLKDGEIACKVYRLYEKADVLRSPHLYMEHAVRTITHEPEIYEWFYTKGVYTSCHDLLSRILQFDVDGDQLNVVVEPLLVKIAERNIAKFDVVPLFYDANKAPSECLSRDTMFNGLKRAHDYSGIGQISNALTKLWNRDDPDWDAAAWLCYYNNLVIDAAKTGKVNSYEQYPAVNARIKKATGGSGKGVRMPHFFQYTVNGRRAETAVDQKKQFSK